MPKPYLTPEQYLEIERAAAYRSEYHSGEMFAMPGSYEAHCLIVVNVAAGLNQQLRARPCRVYHTEMRVQITPTGMYTYPDVIVVCGEPQFLDDRRDTLLNPNLIVEVLSESTEAYDRGKKFEHYRTLESLFEYLLIASDRVGAELFTRQPDGRWLLSAAGSLEESLELSSIGCRLTLADVYEKVGLSLSEIAIR